MRLRSVEIELKTGEERAHQSLSTRPLAVHVEEHCDLSNLAQLLTFAFE